MLCDKKILTFFPFNDSSSVFGEPYVNIVDQVVAGTKGAFPQHFGEPGLPEFFDILFFELVRIGFYFLKVEHVSFVLI